MDDDSLHMYMERHEELHMETFRCLLLLLMLENSENVHVALQLTCASVAALMHPSLSFFMFSKALYSMGLLAASLCKACMAVPGMQGNDYIKGEQHTGSVASSSTEVTVWLMIAPGRLASKACCSGRKALAACITCMTQRQVLSVTFVVHRRSS